MAKYFSPALRSPVGRAFWREWVLANAIGGALGWAVFASVYGVMGDLFGGANESAAFRTITGAMTWSVVYGLIGIAQWLLLRRMIPRSGLWILASVAGGVTFAVVAETLFAAQGGAEVGAVGGAAAGVASGVLQQILLRRVFTQTELWAPASLLAGLISSAVGWSLIAPVLQALGGKGGVALAWAICGAIGGTLGGAITGAVLIGRLRRLRGVRV